MDPQIDLPDLVEDLQVNIDELRSTLSPLLPPHTLAKTSGSLPVLEKAKLYVLFAYAIESLLFSTLQASGIDAKAHAIFPELARLKTYFGKIKAAEDFLADRAQKDARARLDVGAAQRFIRHGLGGNERYDEMRRARMAGEKERALLKARELVNRTFSDGEGDATKKRGVEGGEGDRTNSKKLKGETAGGEVAVGEVAVGETAEGETAEDETAEGEAEREERDDDDDEADADTPPPAPKRGRKGGKPAVDLPTSDAAATKKKRGRPSKSAKPAADTASPTAPPQQDTPARATRSSATRAKAPAKGRGKK
ncbi:uncharacterized protein M421DRAFT_120793 [Didymella exigua CBS 183.55]|uniref:Exosome complex protein n=1 Tax=Didymella exigua CBS 183.55 TaxID=1150837 RepID=A0A6A5S7G9_9PLEO|nr:uncharacterized protein M421DRAFT_120793 [Didymella exigua CBS 183.55]KAF1934426.1 hypothetical protein M421DRAFT_120793 [Didymella exigua CBS 183.55]